MIGRVMSSHSQLTIAAAAGVLVGAGVASLYFRRQYVRGAIRKARANSTDTAVSIASPAKKSSGCSSTPLTVDTAAGAAGEEEEEGKEQEKGAFVPTVVIRCSCGQWRWLSERGVAMCRCVWAVTVTRVDVFKVGWWAMTWGSPHWCTLLPRVAISCIFGHGGTCGATLWRALPEFSWLGVLRGSYWLALPCDARCDASRPSRHLSLCYISVCVTWGPSLSSQR